MKLSPHTWGCTVDKIPQKKPIKVVPTHVGVYRSFQTASKTHKSCPHTRGGVPDQDKAKSFYLKLSPHTWGCTGSELNLTRDDRVVPTHVGVYRDKVELSKAITSCPHTCGGVPIEAFERDYNKKLTIKSHYSPEKKIAQIFLIDSWIFEKDKIFLFIYMPTKILLSLFLYIFSIFFVLIP